MKLSLPIVFFLAVPVFADPAVSSRTTAANLKAGAAAAQAAFATDTAKTAPDSTAIRRKAYRDAEVTEATWRQAKLTQLAQAKDSATRAALLAELDARWTAAQPALATLKAVADSASTSPATATK